MKLLKLEIENVRGIKKLLLEPQGRNVVIWGPNGSGKSAVVDAVEFLFSGKISRLLGPGTGDVSLGEHGPHINHEPKEAVVRATIKIPDSEDPIQLERRMSAPSELKFPTDKKEILTPLLDLAIDSKHVLSRREIIRFVAAEPRERAEQVQTLLRLDEIESLRQTFVNVQRKSEQEKQDVEAEKIAIEKHINETLGLELFRYEECIAKVNELRSMLGGKPLDDLHAENISKDLKTPFKGDKEVVDIVTVKNQIAFLRKFIVDSAEPIEEYDETLRRELKVIREDKKLRKEQAALRLLEIGISLVTGEGFCPLCETPWPPGELKKRLEERKLRATEAESKQKLIRELSQEIRGFVETVKSSVENIETSLKKLGLHLEGKKLEDWHERLKTWVAELLEPEEKYCTEWPSPELVRNFLADSDIDKTLEQIQNVVGTQLPKISEEQKAWVKLIEFGTIWKQYQEVMRKVTLTNLFHTRSSSLLSCFIDARDAVLTSLYEDIEKQFNDYYKQLHGEDERSFEASLKPHGPKLSLEVDFYGRGKHHPLAMHSEGHQDSMGLCLYLALSTRLIEDKIDMTVLDDVVMSIDSGHRRNICKLLNTQFPNRQFLITTHDRTWARQLKTEGLVTTEEMLEFGRWSIETGPIVGFDSDVWTKIEKALSSNDVRDAATTLRYNAEQFFELACDNLRAKVEYRGDCRWDLGDYLPGAIERYREYIKKAKKAAKLWKQQDKFEKMEELETVSAEIIRRAQVEQWAINENVHHNRWGDFSKEDFQPLVEAFQDLFELFQCSSCGGMLYALPEKGSAEEIRCRCLTVSWNLIGSKKD